jgi:diguanylate cyclase (GGDEF)-like protein
VRRLRLTSPGLLLIFAVVAAGGIFILDAFYLRPNVESHKWAALREQALRAENTARLALRTEEDDLLHACVAWTQVDSVGSFPKTPASPGPVDAYMRQAMGSSDVDLAWICDQKGKVLRAWNRTQRPEDVPTAQQQAQTVISAVGDRVKNEGVRPAGLIKTPTGPVTFAYRVLADPQQTTETLGYLWLARSFDSDVLERVAAAVGGDLLLVAGDSLPKGTSIQDPASHSLWLADEDRLVVAWPVCDAAGKSMGYFRAELPVSQIHRQAVNSRRMVLIVLSLSVGLTLLVIVGTHILVTGPVVRLLQRLQELEAGGKGSAGDLVRDLHGEPLLLARRLESAFDRLAQMSKTDQLTGLANRRDFEEVLEAFYHQARRYNRALSLMVMDLDFFKAVNDTGGHQAGDELLKIVAGAIERACRKADLPSRFGGDEFAILLPETVAHDAARVAERLRVEICGKPLSVAKDLQVNVTLSVGIADLNSGEMDSPQAMMALADRALYTAKEMGRNRVVQAHDLNGVDWRTPGEASGKVDTLCRKLAGLDSQFKDVFLNAVEEIVVMLEQRDPHMADHARKVRHYSTQIAREMELSDRIIQRVQIAAMLHDVGMLAMPDSMLLCPGELSPQQVALMRKHPLIGVRMMEGMEFLEQEIPAVRYHHERWDGKGYPEGLSGSSIPLSARIVAVADAFDAMTSPRTFRKARSAEEALQDLKLSSQRQFDPAVVNAFLAVAERIGADLVTSAKQAASKEQAAAHLNQPAGWRLDVPAEPT